MNKGARTARDEFRRRSAARRFGLSVAAILFGAAVIFMLWPPSAGPQSDELLAEAQAALETGDLAKAEKLAGAVLDDDPDSASALSILGRAAARRRQFAEAVAFWDKLPPDAGPAAAADLTAAGQIALGELHRPSQAEQFFRRALRHDPDAAEAIRALAYLLAVEGRRQEAISFILDSFRNGDVNIDQLALLGMPQGVVNDPELVRNCYAADQHDPGALAAMAASTTLKLKPQQARQLMEEAVRAAPEMIDVQVRLGALLLEANDDNAFVLWHERLPEQAAKHAEIWALRGAAALRRNEPRVAARCYWETLRRDPNHRAALYQLSRLLIAFDDQQAAAPLAERAGLLQQLQQSQDVLFNTEHASLEPMRRVAQQLQSLGRVWEAWGWSRVALQMNPQEPWAGRLAQQLEEQLPDSSQLTLAAANPVKDLDLSSYPLPDWEQASQTRRSTHAAAGAISFSDDAAAAGLRFTYFNDPRPAAAGKRMYELPGGGAAVLDYDVDGWPDIYLTQGARWPPDADQRQHLDGLFRNLDGRRFEQATLQAGAIENRFSHGATVGDFDGDGFADLYIANIGANRLLRNNGDGTFSDVSSIITGDAQRWTTSCLLADLNGDGLPDLYDVNYVEAEDVFERICKHGDGAPRMCLPFSFPGAPDQLYVNQGDGRFAEASSAAGIDLPEGKGLGVAAGDFNGSGRLSLLIANDTTANFYFSNVTQPPAAAPRFQERGLAAGVAFNSRGRAEGCMGIAVGDVNQDARLDFFIGNFLKESNTLYLQQPGGFFDDATSRFNLAQESLDSLAFGAQFLDADLDGDLDLIVTNGHVDDVRAYGRPYQMRPQFFENPGNGPFVERFGDSLGPFFSGEYLGRGLARLDYNRDGRQDVVISHIQSPAALLTNTSTPHGNWLKLHLRGVSSCRDAIGATVIVSTDGRAITRQLTAGDGYQSSNERVIVVGLGNTPIARQLQVRWPSGAEQSFDDVSCNTAWVCVEGRAALFEQRAE